MHKLVINQVAWGSECLESNPVPTQHSDIKVILYTASVFSSSLVSSSLFRVAGRPVSEVFAEDRKTDSPLVGFASRCRMVSVRIL